MKKAIFNFGLIVFLLEIFFSPEIFAQQSLKVLFIGNSFTYFSDLPGKLKALAAADGKTVVVDSHTPGGEYCTDHMVNPIVYSKMHSQVWDYVVIQDNQGWFANTVHNVTATNIAANMRLRDSVHAIIPCASVIWFAGWGPKGGVGLPGDNTANCINRIDTNYQYMNNMYPAKKEIIAPFGKAWNTSMAQKPAINLFNSDNTHPGLAGTFLNANVLFATIFKQDPSNINYTAGLNATDAAFLRSTGYKTVVSSAIFPTHNLISITPVIAFTGGMLSASSGYTSYQWFNNNVSIAGATSANYTPSAPGSYCVLATNGNGCQHFLSFPYDVNAVGVLETQVLNNVSVYPNPFSEYTVFDLKNIKKGSGDQISIRIYNILGNEMADYQNISAEKFIMKKDDLSSGIYLYEIKMNEKIIGSGKLIIQ